MLNPFRLARRLLVRHCTFCFYSKNLLTQHLDRLTSPAPRTAIMITRFLTDVRVTFNPFSPRSKPARLFLSLIPPDARADGMKIESKMLPRHSKEPATLGVKFSMYHRPRLAK